MPRGRKKTIPKVRPPKTATVDVDLTVPPFHVCFPHLLTHTDGDDHKKCWFSCPEHMESYIKRYNLKKGTFSVSETQPKNPLDIFFNEKV
jgi:hypothetical protein